MKNKIINQILTNIKAMRKAQKETTSWVEIEKLDFAILQLECQIAEIRAL